MTYYDIAPAVSAYFFCCFVCDRLSITQLFFAFQTCAWLLQIYNCSKVINMTSWPTHEIELLISEIEERQCLWNIFNPEYKDRVKKSDAWKEVSEVLDRKSAVCSAHTKK